MKQNLQYNQLTRPSSERSVLIIYEFKEILISRVREIPFLRYSTTPSMQQDQNR